MGFWKSVGSLFYPRNLAGAHAALTRFDMAEKIFERVDRLSGGERQRVGLARALLSPSSAWLVDEPLSALDPTRAALVMETLTVEARVRGVTLVMTLHQVEVALARFPRIIGLRDGLVSFDLPSSEVTPARLAQLYAQHEHELTGAAFPSELPLETQVADPANPPVMHCR